MKEGRFKGFLVVYKRTGYVPVAVQYDTYEDALNMLEEIARDKLNNDARVIVCILNHKMEVVYKTEAGIDA
ncbi:MAG: hypothetical protein J6U00_01600 [Ruminococcus sp.]|uniref:hypothetical protein n=1 Tax=Ruminococcus sp. TaxID=41978 RepID=UPI001B1E4E3A|nr:hypothetical protein [Ruminococcus sp.]MBO7472693.1 hypothetical protein [Ruminococcus sp.]